MQDDAVPIPEILRANYPEFRLRISKLPLSHQGWLVIFQKAVRGRRSKDIKLRLVAISPIEFDAFWHAHGNGGTPAIDSLWQCAIDKGHQPGSMLTIDEQVYGSLD